MFRQYYANRFRSMYPPVPKKVGRKTVYYKDPRDRLNPLNGFTAPIVCREPWIVEAWIPRNYAQWDAATRRFRNVRIRGGHLAVVRSLRSQRTTTVADWILLACADAGLDWQLRQRTTIS
jgi:hypothetical protein